MTGANIHFGALDFTVPFRLLDSRGLRKVGGERSNHGMTEIGRGCYRVTVESTRTGRPRGTRIVRIVGSGSKKRWTVEVERDIPETSEQREVRTR